MIHLLLRQKHKRYFKHMLSSCFSALVFIAFVLIQYFMHLKCHCDEKIVDPFLNGFQMSLNDVFSFSLSCFVHSRGMNSRVTPLKFVCQFMLAFHGFVVLNNASHGLTVVFVQSFQTEYVGLTISFTLLVRNRV